MANEEILDAKALNREVTSLIASSILQVASITITSKLIAERGLDALLNLRDHCNKLIDYEKSRGVEPRKNHDTSTTNTRYIT